MILYCNNQIVLKAMNEMKPTDNLAPGLLSSAYNFEQNIPKLGKN